jgi:hypothetical protein
MKAGPVKIGTLLQNRNRYCVPIYQRHYVWNREKQWEPSWQDITVEHAASLRRLRERRDTSLFAVTDSLPAQRLGVVPAMQTLRPKHAF